MLRCKMYYYMIQCMLICNNSANAHLSFLLVVILLEVLVRHTYTHTMTHTGLIYYVLLCTNNMMFCVHKCTLCALSTHYVDTL